MRIRIGTDAADVAKAMKSAMGRQINFALVNTVNDLAFEAQKDHKKYANKVFDRPTRWTENATQVRKAVRTQFSRSTGARMMRYMQAWVQLKDDAYKGTAPTTYLKAQAMGGKRADKRSESALRAKGILPQGMQTLVMPKYQDKHGNIRGPLMVKILSYLRAFGEQGYNMNRNLTAAQRKAALRTMKAMNQNADKYFVLTSRKTKKPVGIFERKAGKATSGMQNIEPVLMFIPAPTYKKRYDLKDQVMRVVTRRRNNTWQRNYARAISTMKYRTSAKPKIQF